MKRRAKKRLSPYRRLEAELADARAAEENAVDEYMKTLTALRDALAIIDAMRKQSGYVSGWIVLVERQTKRIEEMRALLKP